jgi:hypothetical protein
VEQVLPRSGAGGSCGEVAQTMYINVSKCKNAKLKERKKEDGRRFTKVMIPKSDRSSNMYIR